MTEIKIVGFSDKALQQLADLIRPNKQRKPWERHIPECGTAYRGCSPDCPKEQFDQAVLLAVKEEREECASIVEAHIPYSTARDQLQTIALEIRERGKP